MMSEKPEGAPSAVLLAAYYGQSTVAEFLAPRVESLDLYAADGGPDSECLYLFPPQKDRAAG